MTHYDMAKLVKDENSWFLIETGSDGYGAIVVQGWQAVVKEYACMVIDDQDPDSVLDDAESQLVSTYDDDWTFMQNGGAKLYISFEDGYWQCIRVTENKALDKEKA